MEITTATAPVFTPPDVSLVRFWTNGDWVSHVVVLTLVLMCLISWVQIIYKGIQLGRAVYLPVAIQRFWRAGDMEWGESELARQPVALSMLTAGRIMAQQEGQYCLSLQGNKADAVTRSIRASMSEGLRMLEHGLTMLASIGAVAPFVGLFGTVWGIYHALSAIGNQGSASIANVSGPVGEALIMTAAGLFVAIPAVLAYNSFARSVRVVAQELDGFAYDLQGFFRAKPQAETKVYDVKAA